MDENKKYKLINPNQGPIGPGASPTPNTKWTDYGFDVFDLNMTFRWDGENKVLVFDRCRNFNLFEEIPCMPTLDGAKAAIRRAKTRYAYWISNNHPAWDFEANKACKKYGVDYEDIGNAGPAKVLLFSLNIQGRA